MNTDPKIEVIRKRDLEPGDIVMVKYPKGTESPNQRLILESCELIFKDYGVRVVGCPDDINFEIMKGNLCDGPDHTLPV